MAGTPIPGTATVSERLARWADAAAATAAIGAAHRLGVLACLAAGPVEPVSLAAGCGISERGARLLLAALAGFDLVELQPDGTYRAGVPGLDRAAGLLNMWGALDEVIRSGRPAARADSPASAQSLYRETADWLGALMAQAAERAADCLFAPGLEVLDVGAGAAPWSLALAARDPTTTVTAVDLPGVAPATRAAVAAAGREAQFRLVAGDMFAVDWGPPGSYDLALAGNIFHLFDPAANHRLLRRLFRSLRPGGTVAIIDALPDEDLNGPGPVMLYALGLMMRTAGGAVYPLSSYLRWLHDTGFETVEPRELTVAPPLTLLTARRPPE